MVTKVGTERTIQPSSAGYFIESAVTDLDDGGFVIAWSDNSSDIFNDSRSEFRSAQNSVTAAFNISAIADVDEHNVSLDQLESTGAVAFAWEQDDGRIYFNAIDDNGVVQAASTQIDSISLRDFDPVVASRQDGSFVVGFQSDFSTDTDIAAVARDGNGNVQAFNVPFGQINDFGNQKDLSISALSNNRTLLVWSTDADSDSNIEFGTDKNGTFGLRAAIFDKNGNLLKNVGLVNFDADTSLAKAAQGDQVESSTAVLSNGGFVVTWTDNSLSKGDTAGSAIFARIYDAEGNARGDSFQVNTTIKNDQSQSSVCALTGGGFAVAWTDNSGATTDIRVRIFNAAGSPVDSQDTVINTSTGGDQIDAHIAGLENGTAVVSWTDQASSPNGTNGGSAVRYQIVSASGGETPGDNIIRGTEDSDKGANAIKGTAGDDIMQGLGGKDELIGSAGSDELDGGDGTDTAVYTDRVQLDLSIANGSGSTGQAEGDTFKSIERFVLSGKADKAIGDGSGNYIKGGAGKDSLSGNGGKDTLYGGDDGDTLKGGSGKDKLYGEDGKDKIDGGSSDDLISGGEGSDKLKGGTGDDIFVFSTKLSAKNNVDKISDFNHADDVIRLDNDVFRGLGRGKLDDDAFHIGKEAADKQDRIIYDKAKGDLYFDRDGTKDKYDAIKFATVSDDTKVTASDFEIVT